MKEEKTRYIECTGSPKPFFKTKQEFLDLLTPFNFEHGKMTKRNNNVSILITNDLGSSTNKMRLARELGVEIMTYEDLSELFEIL